MEGIFGLFTNKDFLSSIPNLLLLVAAVAVLVKTGVLKVKTDHVQLGGAHDEKAELERTIIRNQATTAHDFIKGLEPKVCEKLYGAGSSSSSKPSWHVKYSLELVYDKCVEWIMFNHIEDCEAYVSCKQDEVVALIHSLYVGGGLATAEFDDIMRGWTLEMVKKLVAIRKMYTDQYMRSKK